jgi:hypothetical protein
MSFRMSTEHEANFGRDKARHIVYGYGNLSAGEAVTIDCRTSEDTLAIIQRAVHSYARAVCRKYKTRTTPLGHLVIKRVQ